MNRVRKYFFSGLAVFLPLGLTIQVFLWALKFTDNILGGYLKRSDFDLYFPGLGIILLVSLIFLSGVLITHYFGRVIHQFIEGVFMRIPIIATIYSAFKEVSRFVFQNDSLVRRAQKVVLIQWPRPGVYTIGFLTNQTPRVICDKAGRQLVNVLIPNVPNPLSGFVMMFPLEDVQPLDMSVQDAIRIIVSGGVVDPHAVSRDENPAA